MSARFLLSRKRFCMPGSMRCDDRASNKGISFAIPRSWKRAQKPLKPGNTKKIRKNDEIPHPGSGPENTKKNTEKIQKRPKNHRFSIFSAFFSYFRGPTRGGGFRHFFVFFRISGLEGFLSSIPGTRNRKIS